MMIKYPKFSNTLVKLAKEDQYEIRNHYQKLKLLNSDEEKIQLNMELKAHCHSRANIMMGILDEIREPSVTNIGIEGSEMVSLLALHSYLDEMKLVLAAYEKAYRRDPGDVYMESIPSLTDRIMILEHRKQLYGNNWMIDRDGKYFLITVEDFEHMNERRAKFGVGPRMKPTVYAIGEEKYPLGKGPAEVTDQKDLTDQEYAEFSKGHLR